VLVAAGVVRIDSVVVVVVVAGSLTTVVQEVKSAMATTGMRRISFFIG
jgi:hypothetical protein